MRHSIVLRIVVGAAIIALLIPLGINAAEDATETNEFIVKAPDSEALQAFVDSSGLEIGPLITYPNPSEEVLRYTRHTWIVSVPDSLQSVKDSLVEVLKAQPWVEYVEPNAIIQIEPEVEGESEGYHNMPDSFPWPYTPNDPLYNQQWNMRITRTNWAWNLSTGQDVKVGIIDTGIDTDHEDLVDNIDFGHSYNFRADNTNINDTYNHGTLVSGIAAAKIDNGLGVAGFAGNADICVFKGGSSGIYPSAAANALYYAADSGILIINMSFGDYTFRQSLADATDYAWNHNVFICASAGNDNKNASGHYPSAYEHVMAVGGSTESDQRVSNSNFGPNVEIYAPGWHLITTTNTGDYVQEGGTSFASPHIAGLAALLWEENPDWSNQQIWDRIIESADTIQIDKGKVLRMNSMKALGIDSVGIAEPVTSITHLSNWQVTASIGRQITLRYADHPQGFSASIFDATGRKVDEVNSNLKSGTIEWGEGFNSGVYFVRVEDGSSSFVQKVILIR